MAKRKRRHKCRNCRELFHPDHRNRKKQKYCSEEKCQAASKKASNDRWRRKKENRDYFSGPQQVARVQEWRKLNPGYSCRKRINKKTLQDLLSAESPASQGETGSLKMTALQDYLNRQSPVIIGLIAKLTENTLQDDIAQTITNMRQLGRDILSGIAGDEDCSIQLNGGSYDNKTSYRSATYPQSASKVQLDRSSSGS